MFGKNNRSPKGRKALSNGFFFGVCLAIVLIQLDRSRNMFRCDVPMFLSGNNRESVWSQDIQMIATQLTHIMGNNKELSVTTVVTPLGRCECELISVDCLDSVRCLPEGSTSQRMVAMGVWTRQTMKRMTRFAGDEDPLARSPLGKSTQYGAILGWQLWTEGKSMPFQYAEESCVFINETRYPYCRELNLKGKPCIFYPSNSEEDLDPMEEEAMNRFQLPPDKALILKQDVALYNSQSRKRGNKIPALGHLLVMAHIVRIRFNRRPPITDTYNEHIRTFDDHIKQRSLERMSRKLRVGLHLRRADACKHEKVGFSKTASPLDSPAQTQNRLCYETIVYISALRRLSKMTDRPLEVYLSTDDSGSVLEQIRSEFPDIYNMATWKILDFSRRIFRYDSAIESLTHNKHALLGEAAVADLWLLSHSEVFIGHLGSRFGKISWLLATARYNRFVPFLSVDGHSYCCEIDEACGQIKPYIRNMENCMTFNHELLIDEDVNSDYWDVGSMMRKIKVEKRDREMAQEGSNSRKPKGM